MNLDIIVVTAILTITVVLFVTEWLRVELSALIALLALTVSGMVTPREALAGFSSNAVIAIVSLLIISAGLVRTGTVKWIACRLHALAGKGQSRLIALTAAVPGLLSGFVSVVAAVSVFIPAVMRIGRVSGAPVSRLLMPMAFAAMAGANLSLFGASHNLVAHDLLRGAEGRGFGLFELAPVGLILLLFTILYMTLLAHRLLPDHKDLESRVRHPTRELMKRYGVGDRLWEIWIGKDADILGQRLRELDIEKDYGLSLLCVVRNDDSHFIHHGKFELQADDVLLVGGQRQRAAAFSRDRKGLKLLGPPEHHEDFPSSSSGELIELAVSPHARIIGKTLRDLKFRINTGLTGVAVWRAGQPVRTDVSALRLQEGDAVLFLGARESTRGFVAEPDWLWLQRPKREEAPRELRHLRLPAVLIGLAVLVGSAAGWLPIAIAALAGAVGMILLGALGPKQAYDSVDWRTVILIGAMLPMGTALQHSGASALLAETLVAAFQGLGPLAVMMAVALCALLLTQPLHNAAVAVIMVPVALDAAQLLDANPHAFVGTVVVAASATFLLPTGHPAALLIRQPGHYRLRDYLRFGAGPSVITLAVIAVFVPWLWPLHEA
jgi:di/tricarboxylate transporter